ncbi:Z1 domain-containing protein [Corynebacterium lubricantis]|uniref:Z1 domain-containing protein n=1 Tax=Corynebacterium lubricantis TaxID=541095 RepID=UPI00037CD76F|nr:Z1 domain-containing protein [Corynebacterium lubricantis]
MSHENLDEEIIVDYLEEFQDAARLGKDLEAAARKWSRRVPHEASEIEEALNRVIKAHTPVDSGRRDAAYRRKDHNWYRPFPDRDHFWPAFKKVIEKDLGPAVKDIDESSTQVLNGFRPSTEEQNSKGLVLGYVQSGKTTNFMSVIAKAADAGFRLIIVLTGITENLRQQTQDRLEDQLINPQAHLWLRLTDHDNDFSGDINGARLGNVNDRFIAVVKKNPHRLRRLNEWLIDNADVAENCPILVIDDEADQASINVSNHSKAERSAINRQIAQLLDRKRTVYTAYTATPFANILIDPNEGDDLYPRDFIVTLPEPKGYFGSRALFGRAPLNGESRDELEYELDGFDMIRTIPEDEVDGIRPGKGDEKGKPVVGGDQLKSSIRWFILASAARRARGQENKHSSMLVHTSMLTADHEDLRFQVEVELSKIRKEYEDGSDRSEWEAQWVDETARVPAEQFGLTPLSFSEIEPRITETLQAVQVVVDNGASANRLNYDNGVATVIAIGGNTLSRGLTLEGLVSSYFVRRASAYDTLLQMGRWFGFRNGYQDLPRIWMPDELRRWFYDLATIEAELRETLNVYMQYGESPLDIQAHIRLHPDMQVTSKAKMQDQRPASMSFSENKEQTIQFKEKDRVWLTRNLDAAKDLVSGIHKRGIPEEVGLFQNPVFRKVPNQLIQDFLDAYQIHEQPRLGQDNARLLKSYIRKEATAGRMLYWNVSFVTQEQFQDNEEVDLGLNHPIRTLTRTKLKTFPGADISIKALVSAEDRLNDVVFQSEADRTAFRSYVRKQVKENDKETEVRKLHENNVGPGIGHLAIYPIRKDSKPRNWDSLSDEKKLGLQRVPLDAAETVIGIGMFFPKSTSAESRVDYVSAPEANEEIREAYLRYDEEVDDINENDERVLEGSVDDNTQ